MLLEIYDDLIPKTYQQEIKNLLLGNRFPWYYISDVTYLHEKDSQNRPATVHKFVENYESWSNYWSFINPLMYITADKIGLDEVSVEKSRSFLQFPLDEKFRKGGNDYLHVDRLQKHIVFLYYVCDSDGDTIIVDKTCNPNIEEQSYLKDSDFPVLERVTPKQGRMLVFDGSYYHTAEQPKNNTRCVINANLDLK